MDKLKFETPDMVSGNIDKIAALFPSAITEMRGEDGEIKRGVNFGVLKQLLSRDVVDGDECYEFTWVGKKAAMAEAARPITKTLRPVKEDSRDWDTTENIYIEGDNLEVLKLLQESYLGKVKMIYIDPPYNTGHDFVYPDSFVMDNDEYNAGTGYFNEDGSINYNRENSAAGGRYHSDWCNMIYSRLMLARNLLTDDGVIFISIDDNEQTNLCKICDEVFGAENRIGPLIQNKQNAKNDTINVQKNHEFILVYRKAMQQADGKIEASLVRTMTNYRDVFEDAGRFYYLNDPITTRGDGGTLNARPNLGYTVYYDPNSKEFIAVVDYNTELAKIENDESIVYSDRKDLLDKGYISIRPPRVRGKLGCWTWAINKFNAEKDNLIIAGKNGNYTVRKRTFVDSQYIENVGGKLVFPSTVESNSRSILDFSTNEGTNELNSLIKGNLFSNPKNLDMLKYLISLIRDTNICVLDFFSGSATTAHAVMQLNAEDGGHRKFIMVQLPEKCDESSEAYKAGYKNICEIGKERIRRAGDKIKSEHPNAQLDTGFRVFRVDESNMEDVYYHPEELTQTMLGGMVSNIKSDRSDLDLLYACLLDWGVEINLPHSAETLDGCTIHNVDDGALVACFNENVPDTVIRRMADLHPLRAVFRDSSFASDDSKINVTEIFKNLSPDTNVKVI